MENIGTTWSNRPQEDEMDADEMYTNKPTYFSLKVFHGGTFTEKPDIKYVNGNTSYIDYADIEDFGMNVLEQMLKSIGYPSDMVFYFYYKVPYLCLDLGLKPLGDDNDFHGLFEFVKRGIKQIDLYVEHWNSRLMISLEYLVGPSNQGDDAEVVDLGFNERFHVENEDVSDRDDHDLPLEDPDNTLHVVEVNMDTFDAHKNYDVEVENVGEEVNGDGDDTNVDLEDIDINIEEDPTSTNLKRAGHRVLKQRKKYEGPPLVNPFYIGQLIVDKEKATEMVKKYAVESRRQIYIKKNDAKRFRVVCMGITGEMGVGGFSYSGSKTKPKKPDKRKIKPTCPWLVYISRSSTKDQWCVKTVIDQHTCLQTRDVGLYTRSTIAKEIKPLIRANPEMPIPAIQEMLEHKHQIHLSDHKVFRAKSIASKAINGDYRDQYARLRDYCLELLRTNPGSTIKIDVENEPNPNNPTRQFKRIYVCYGAMKKGFKICGREIVGLDGCFMKGPYPGQILTAVGIDGNNGIYPVAYALVEAENYVSWKWFLELLGDDIDLPTNGNFTFVSDRQKGLIPALAKVFPSAEHRFCVRHIHENMKKKWRGDIFKGMLWKAASATSMPYFKKAMENIQVADKKLYEWLMQIPPSSWSRAHFSGRPKCDVLLNNLCEVFNSQLRGARDKPVITCLEYIREYMTKRIVKVKKIQAQVDGPLTPAGTKLFESIKDDASQMKVLMTGSSKYQVNGPWGGDGCIVDMDAKTCSCRKWELTGMPCKHAVAAIWDMSAHGMNVGLPENWVDKVYFLDTWKHTYMCTIDPINGPDMWPESSCPTTLVPPKHHKQVGRPKKARKRTIEEIQEKFDKNGKMTRMGNTTTCGKCGNKGHNQRSCKGQGESSRVSQSATQGAPMASHDTH